MQLRDGQWGLAYGPAGNWPGADFTFGTISTGYYLLEAPEIAFGDVRAGDAEMPLEDGVRFGIDYRPGATVTFQVGVDTVGWGRFRHAQNLDALGEFRRVWQADAVRTRPGAVAELVTNQAGRVRSLFGRPRRWSAASGVLTKQGYTPVVCDFGAAEDRWYGQERTVRFGITTPAVGGGRFPWRFPATHIGTSAASSQVTVEGNVKAWPIFTIFGPTVSPTIEIGGHYRVTLSTSLSYDQVVTIDSRPWARTVLRNDGANLAGALAQWTPMMRDLGLAPGTWPVVIKGQDLTGTSSVTVAWRDAYNYL